VPFVAKTTATTPLGASNLLDTAMPLLQALSKAKMVSATFTWGYFEDDPVTDATNGEVEEKAEISCALVLSGSGPGQTTKATISIPAPVDALFQATSGSLYNVVEPSNAALQSALALYETGFGVAGAFTLSDYQGIQDPTLPGNVSGKRIHKGSKKG